MTKTNQKTENCGCNQGKACTCGERCACKQCVCSKPCGK